MAHSENSAPSCGRVTNREEGVSDAGGKRYRVGVIGFAHMHVNELVHQFIASGRADIVACADNLCSRPCGSCGPTSFHHRTVIALQRADGTMGVQNRPARER